MATNLPPVWGFRTNPPTAHVGHQVGPAQMDTGEVAPKDHNRLDTALKIAGYIPILGMVSGVIHMANGIKSNESKSIRAQRFLRGVTEFIGLGVTLTVIDLAVTLLAIRPPLY